MNWSRALRILSRPSIRDPAELWEFLGERSAHVAQTCLFGYLQTRMGPQWRTIFQDEAFRATLATSQRAAFFYCLGDLTLWCCATVLEGHEIRDEIPAIARACHDRAARTAYAGATEAEALAFAQRLEATDWVAAQRPEVAFASSPEGVLAAAPVSEDFRAEDRAIVTNSVSFQWIEVRRAFRTRVRPERLRAGLAEIGK